METFLPWLARAGNIYLQIALIVIPLKHRVISETSPGPEIRKICFRHNYSIVIIGKTSECPL